MATTMNITTSEPADSRDEVPKLENS
jgi:hypothetical protein